MNRFSVIKISGFLKNKIKDSLASIINFNSSKENHLPRFPERKRKRKLENDPPRVLLVRVSLSLSDYPRRKIHASPESDEGRRKNSTSTETNKTPPEM